MGEPEGRPTVRELWAELGASMRILRQNAGMSLRQVEQVSGRGRGTLSQVENGKARPGRDLVEWYDDTFAGDGLLLALFAEARGAHGPSSGSRVYPHVRPGDAMRIDGPLVADGELVACGSDVVVGWTLVNQGAVPWSGRRLERVGAHAAARLIASAPFAPVPDCAPGGRVKVELAVTVPAVPGTFAAHWVVVDADGRPCFDTGERLHVLLIAR